MDNRGDVLSFRDVWKSHGKWDSLPLYTRCDQRVCMVVKWLPRNVNTFCINSSLPFVNNRGKGDRNKTDAVQLTVLDFFFRNRVRVRVHVNRKWQNSCVEDRACLTVLRYVRVLSIVDYSSVIALSSRMHWTTRWEQVDCDRTIWKFLAICSPRH